MALKKVVNWIESLNIFSQIKEQLFKSLCFTLKSITFYLKRRLNYINSTLV